MKQVILILFLLIFSCEELSSKKVSTRQLVEEELQSIDWNDVDTYPAFRECEAFVTKQERKSCFENYLYHMILDQVKDQNFIVGNEIADTVRIKIHIDKTGTFSIKQIDMDVLTREELPELDSILRQSFAALPSIEPAHKRGQQVSTEFVLPVIINIE